jgi:hypothetical protein
MLPWWGLQAFPFLIKIKRKVQKEAAVTPIIVNGFACGRRVWL